MDLKSSKLRVLLLGTSGGAASELEREVASRCSCTAVPSTAAARLELSAHNFDAVLVACSAFEGAIADAAALAEEHPGSAILAMVHTEPLRAAARAAGLETVEPGGGSALVERLARLASRRRQALAACAACRSDALVIQNTAYRQLLESFAAGSSRSQIAAVAAQVAERLLMAAGAAVGQLVGAQMCCIGSSGQMAPMLGATLPREVIDGELARLLTEPVTPDVEINELARAAGIESAAVAPIRSGATIIGVLAVTASHPGAFSEHDLRSLQGVADLVGIGFAVVDAEALRESFLRDLVSGIADERRRLVRDIHDEAGQLLTALIVTLHALEKDRSVGAPQALQTAQQLASRAAIELQRIARGLGPTVMSEPAFEQMIRRLADEHHRTHGTSVDLQFNGLLATPGLSSEVQLALYRIVQEALTNVARHAGASTVSILVRRLGAKVNLIIEDDGVGLDASSKTSGAGLRNINERVELLGGRFDLESSAGAGTALYIEVPLGGPGGEDQGAAR